MDGRAHNRTSMTRLRASARGAKAEARDAFARQTRPPSRPRGAGRLGDIVPTPPAMRGPAARRPRR
jgi:hypothetical protein